MVSAREAFCELPVTAIVEVPAGVAPMVAGDVPFLHPTIAAENGTNIDISAATRIQRFFAFTKVPRKIIERTSRLAKVQNVGGKPGAKLVRGLMIPVV